MKIQYQALQQERPPSSAAASAAINLARVLTARYVPEDELAALIDDIIFAGDYNLGAILSEMGCDMEMRLEIERSQKSVA